MYICMYIVRNSIRQGKSIHKTLTDENTTTKIHKN